MRIKPHSFFVLLCLAVFSLSVFVVVGSKTGLLNGNESNLANRAVTAGKTEASKIFLEITSPEDGAIVVASTVWVKGKTLPRADVFINDSETKADSRGNFSASIGLDEGENMINIIANDAEGNFVEKGITVIVETF